ncbi:S8 family serine peptidase [Actinokineospora sp. NBRC 105648]|uniref:S8 family serine peptidase n=1 Tax=Actinokineospora sp. NBRC 105648 TaxID=3032206 RepID=UPI0024A08445|nr:S8 family serine peptidase [Actinokineospora sp. NBRC 105648]GLZ39052.1 serine protease [Actinokineospora sp. NBRC 105648]
MRRLLALAATVVSAAVGVVALTPAPPSEAAPASAVGTRFLGSITLVTGDHVTVREVGQRLVPAVDPAPGRAGLQFATSAVKDQLMVVPSDAWADLQAGRLDRRLFDVAALLRDGYGDEHRADLPLILPATAPQTGLALTSVAAKAVSLRKEDAADFWAGRGTALTRATDRIWLDGMRKPSLDVSVPLIGAPTAWKSGWTGKGVQVAVLDTGIDGTHADLRKRIAAAKDFTGEGGETADVDGHGTHVASTIAGTGAASNGKYTGVAPDARLLVGKVCGGYGCAESAILAGMQWAVESGAKVVNMSLGGTDTADVDLLEAAVNRLSANALFVVAAGNDGSYGAETVSSPASADAALAVGASDKQDNLAGFSARGPRVHDAALKPEILAPGVDITAARSKYSNLGKKRDKYTSLSGTSMATPHVAGSAAILAQRHPNWSPLQLKAALMASAKRLDGPGAFDQGAGRVDVARAVEQAVYAQPSAVSVGRQAWPHADDPVITKQLSYVNTSAQPLPLRLTLAGDLPAGMFQLSADQVTVPAYGEARVELTVNTAVPAEDKAFSTWVVAEGGTQKITTPVAVDREPESYDLTLRTLDPSGAPSDRNFSLVWGVSLDRYRPVATVDGKGVLRVRKGTYHVDTVVAAPNGDGQTQSRKVVRPTVPVSGDTEVVLDSAAAKPIAIDFDRPGVRPRAVGTGYGRRLPWGTLYAGILGDDLARVFTGWVGDPVPDVVADVGGAWYVPDPSGGVTGAPVTYNLAWFQTGTLPTGFTRHVVDADLARVDSEYRRLENNRGGTKLWLVAEPIFQSGSGYGLPLDLPTKRTEFHSVGNGDWSAEFQQWRTTRKGVVTESITGGEVVRQQPGTTYREDWNTAVIGPALPRDGLATRVNDQISLGVPMFSDPSAGHLGASTIDKASTALYREGVKVGETDQPAQGSWQVPEASASYRLETWVTRKAPMSTEVRSTWTFTSVRPQPRGGKGGAYLPLAAIRFAPEALDPRNHASSRLVRIPVLVQRQDEAHAAPVVGLTVEASFDDGRTWAPAPVSEGVAVVEHPRTAKFVSLRAVVRDAVGNVAEQTVIRAYGA